MDLVTNIKPSINCGGKLLDLNIPKVMGILNVTPDSFYDGGQYSNEKEITNQIEKMIEEGVDIIDVGAFSSRPGADVITAEVELNRLIPILKILKTNYSDTIVSVDTFRSEIANIVVNDYNVSVINDISAGELDSEMFITIAELNVPYIMLHMNGNPQNMQQNTQYNDVVVDILQYFSKKIEQLKLLGVCDILIDPGFGFSKTLDQNYEILKRLREFLITGLPILVGISRKSMIYKLLNKTPDESLNGTSVLNTLALQNGASIIRVHDVNEAKEAIKIYQQIAN